MLRRRSGDGPARETMMLDDASEGMFASDDYVVRRRTRSALCVPIVRHAALLGVLYLENDLASGAFTPDRLAILDLLAKQAAVSVENARLYDGVQRENTERRAAEEKLREQLEIVALQKDAIRTLSTPIIEVWDGIITMPVFGTIDSQRAAEMMEVLLEAVVRTRCRYAILDLTGVEVLDTATASHMIRLVRAVQLLGAEGILVGIGPNVAQTVVSLGVDLSGVPTLANLRQALVRCLADSAPAA